MKSRVMPKAVRYHSIGLASRNLSCVIRTPLVRSLALLGMTAWFIWLLLPKPPLLEGISFSQRVRDRNGKLLRVTLTSDQKYRVWTPLREISPRLIDATLRYEDKYYARHPGVNPIALARSIVDLARFRRMRTGASTITMQLARLRYHLRTRKLSGKLAQIVRALELERHYSKAEILETYLNLAPYGRNIEGVGAASEIYFGKTAAHLTTPESISLSVIPQSPTQRALFVDRNNHSLDSAQNNWYDRAKIDGQFSARLFSVRAQTERQFLAPHFVQHVLAMVGAARCADRTPQRGVPGRAVTCTAPAQG
jgi:penicillin-binding protein 1C